MENPDPDHQENAAEAIQPAIPTGRVKKIILMDNEISRVTAEALFLISCSTELFLQSLAEKAAVVAAEKKRKIVKPEFITMSVKRHRPTSDFLLDCLSAAVSQPSDPPASDRAARSRAVPDKPTPAGARRIDDFFGKSVPEPPTIDVVAEPPIDVVDEPPNDVVDEPSNGAVDEPPNDVDKP